MHQWHVISLLIHGFLPVNARLLIAFGTAFYAIMKNDGLVLMKGYANGNLVYVRKDFTPQVGLEPGTSKILSQHLTY